MGRILALDYGEKRIGVAISDSLGITGQPVTVISSLDELTPIINEYENVELIVVGLPKSLSGEIKLAGQNVLSFVEEVKAKFNLPVKTWDERLTTAQVTKTMIAAGLSRAKRKQVVDKSAAALILQGYLDAKK
ncbi:MAG: Holliday junction resolvase RuvX [bacterium]